MLTVSSQFIFNEKSTFWVIMFTANQMAFNFYVVKDTLQQNLSLIVNKCQFCKCHFILFALFVVLAITHMKQGVQYLQ